MSHLELSKLYFQQYLLDLTVDRFHCDICEYAKHKRTYFPISKSRSLAPFLLVHSDVWGPSTIPNISGDRFFISFIDDCTRVTWVFPMKNKSDVSHIVPNFFNMVKTEFGVGIKRFRSHNARHFYNHTSTNFPTRRDNP